MRLLISCLFLFVSTMLHAQVRWCIVDTNFPEKPLAAMSQVAYLLTNDYNDQLCLVCKDGTVHAGLQGVTFRQLDMTAVRPVRDPADEPSLYADPVGQSLTVSGCRAGLRLQIIDMSGSERLSQMTSDGRTTIDVSRLPSGVYLLNVDETTIKFLKR